MKSYTFRRANNVWDRNARKFGGQRGPYRDQIDGRRNSSRNEWIWRGRDGRRSRQGDGFSTPVIERDWVVVNRFHRWYDVRCLIGFGIG